MKIAKYVLWSLGAFMLLAACHRASAKASEPPSATPLASAVPTEVDGGVKIAGHVGSAKHAKLIQEKADRSGAGLKSAGRPLQPGKNPRCLDELHYSSSYAACMQLPHGLTTSAMVDCTFKESARWDARIRRVDRSIKRRLNAQQRKRFVAAQRAWLKWRQADFDYRSDVTGGTIDRLNSSGYWLDVTARRALDLEGQEQMLEAN